MAHDGVRALLSGVLGIQLGSERDREGTPACRVDCATKLEVGHLEPEARQPSWQRAAFLSSLSSLRLPLRDSEKRLPKRNSYPSLSQIHNVFVVKLHATVNFHSQVFFPSCRLKYEDGRELNVADVVRFGFYAISTLMRTRPVFT